MLKLGTLRWKGRCSRHPRYDPGEGEGAIRGGCDRCRALLEIYDQHQRLLKLMRSFGPIRDRGVRKEPDADRQRSLFDDLAAPHPR